MPLAIRLIGRPSLTCDGRAVELGGRKPWALLSYLILAPTPPSRPGLAQLLWPEAADPLAALRWSLHQVRRAIGPDAEIREAGGRLSLAGTDVSIDVRDLERGDMPTDRLEEVTSDELLAGFFFDDAPAFDQWLVLERQRVGSSVRAALRWSAAILAHRDPTRALRLLQRLVALDPIDDVAHELTLDLYIARGDRAAAERYLATVEQTYRAELGADLPASIRRPLERSAAAALDLPVSPAVTAQALLALATARLETGEYPAAEHAARRAASTAAATGDRALEARSLLTLGGVLVHSVRGRDREAVGLLTRAFQLATGVGERTIASEAARELGYISFLAADYGSAEASLRRAADLADQAGSDAQLGQALTFLAASRIDRGELDSAENALQEALAALDRAGDRRFRSFTLSFVARARIRQGRVEEAEEIAREAAAAAREAGWHSVVPWILVHVAEAALARGRVDDAGSTFSEAFALATEMADPCWEGLSLRGLAQVEARRGDLRRARQLLAEAHQRCTRVPDTLWWADAAILTDLVELEEGRDRRRVDEALAIVRRGPMPELAIRLFRFAPQTLVQTLR